jgi:hypothetical protein
LGSSPDGERRLGEKVRGRTKADVRDKRQALHRELDAGVHTSATYTVAACMQDWLAQGLTDKQPSTVDNYTRLAGHLISAIGAVKLKNLTTRQVQKALSELSPPCRRGHCGTCAGSWSAQSATRRPPTSSRATSPLSYRRRLH